MKKLSLFRKFSDQINFSRSGLSPGTQVQAQRHQKSNTVFRTISYSANLMETTDAATFVLPKEEAGKMIHWIAISGLQNHEEILKCLNHYGIHPLVAEDIFNVLHRPKIEDLDDYLFMTLKYPKIKEGNEHILFEQVSILQMENVLISISEDDIPVVSKLEARINNGQSRFRRLGADYLMYSIIDLITDLYQPALETLDEMQLDLEEQMLEKGTEQDLTVLQAVRKNLIFFKQNLLPLKEALSSIITDKPKLIDQNQIKYFRDILDHIHLALDQIQSLREQNINLTETYLGLQSFKMNEVMKTLTIIATIFIPLTFLAGIYGMNFDHMPELHHPFGYPAVWIVMLATVIGLLIYFRRKKWL